MRQSQPRGRPRCTARLDSGSAQPGHLSSAVIFAPNNPTGVPELSRADELLTQSLKQALALVDIRTLDHFVVAGANVVSFAERGLL